MKPMEILNIPYFDLAQTAQSGQCFRLDRLSPGRPGAWRLISGRRYAEIRQEQNTFFLDCPPGDLAFWRHYLDADTDYGAFLSAVRPDDPYLREAAAAGRGIRILRQDPWEMIITFLISQQKTIPAIRNAVETLSALYGTAFTAVLEDGRRELCHAFPTPAELSRASEADLRALKLGYRAAYLEQACRFFCEHPGALCELVRMDRSQAMEFLTGLYGVGVKVASCVCLYGLHHIDAFPVDTWIRRILMEQYYPRHPRRYGRLPESRRAEAIIRDFFGCYDGFAGVMQQYIFYYERVVRCGRKT